MKTITFLKIPAINDLPRVHKNILTATLILLIFSFSVWAVYSYLPVHDNGNPPETWGFSVDWKGCIQPDTLKLLAGLSPYADGCGLNPPWTYLLLSPVALLSPALGAAVMFVLTYLLYAFSFLRMGAKPLQVVGLALSPFVFINAYNGNIDFLPVLGMVLSPQIGLFFVLMKPQLGAGIALFWLVEAWRKGKLREVARAFGPVALAYGASFALFGLWPLRFAERTSDPFNASLWPIAVPLGLGLLANALRNRNKLFAISATPFLSPYIMIHSYAILLFAFIPYEPLFYLAVAMSWLIMR